MAAAAVAQMRLECQEKGGLRRVHEVHVPVDATVQDVRVALAPLARAKVAGLLLFDGDEFLQNTIHLSDYEITDGKRLLFESRMCGILPADHDWSASPGIKTKRIRGL